MHSSSRRTAAAAAALSALGLSGVVLLPAQPAAAQKPAQRRINLTFVKTDAADVIQAISLQSGTNIVVAPNVRGKMITVRLKGVTIDEALQLVSQAAGASYRKSGNTYLVATPAEFKAAPPMDGNGIYTYVLKYTTPAAARTLIEGALPLVRITIAEGSPALILTGPQDDVVRAQRLLAATDIAPAVAAPTSITVTPANVPATLLAEILKRSLPDATIDVQANTIIVTGPKATVDRVAAIVSSVDTATGAGNRIEVYTIRYSSARALATMLTAAFPNLKATPAAAAYSPPPATLQTSGSNGSSSGGFGGGNSSGGGFGGGGGGGSQDSSQSGGQNGQGGQGGQQRDRSRSLILVGTDAEVDAALKLLTAVDTAPEQVQVEARIIDLSQTGARNLGIAWDGATPLNISELDVRGGFRFGRFARDPLAFTGQLNYLENLGESKTLANPSISVTDNDEASIFIGEERRYQILAGNSATAGQVFTVETLPVGVTLLVHPRVNSDTGEITVNVRPEVSSVTSAPNGLPQTATRTASTTLRVRDGETIIIGGLISDNEIKSIQQVPYLSKIPVLGELFRNRNTTRTRSEVILFLTMRRLRNNGAGDAAAVQNALPDSLKVKPLIPASK